MNPTAPLSPAVLRFTPEPVDDAWQLARDHRLASFLEARLHDTELMSCTDELRAVAWIADVLPDWISERDRTPGIDDPAHTARLDTVGWILRHVASSRWSGHPAWEKAFHPHAVAPPHHPQDRS
ncbi:hypothetical protein ACFWD7_28020 [Streptomyces mirabilis]|uniref:hypothetical protein n=1 Tax=Streptomyces mirabilis TaxID=68239 RepID=UPI0036866A7C